MRAWRNELQVHKRLSVGVTNIVAVVNIPAAKKSFLNKRFVLLKVDRNSTEPCKFSTAHNALGDMQLGNPRTVCIKDAAKDCVWDQQKKKKKEKERSRA